MPQSLSRVYLHLIVSQSNVARVSEYIRNQEDHHRATSFQEEYRMFLRKHAVEFDERYVWD